jgi:HSP20 family molecular chaperone IbpA
MFARRLFNYPSMGWRHPFADLERMSRQMDRLTHGLLGQPGLGWRPASVFPAINLTEDTDKYYLRAELPGIKADALDIQAVGRNLTLSGERTIPLKVKRSGITVVSAKPASFPASSACPGTSIRTRWMRNWSMEC